MRRVSATGRRSRRCSRTRSASRWTRAATFTSQTIEITEYAKYMVVIIFYTFPDDCTEYILSAFISFLLPIMPLLSTKRVQLIRLVVTASAQQRSSATQVRVDDGTVITLAGTGEPGFADGPAASAKFNNPWGAVPRDSPLRGLIEAGIAVDPEGVVYVSDSGNHLIRRISLDRMVTTVAGSGVAGFADGSATAAQFKYRFPCQCSFLSLSISFSLLTAYAVRPRAL